MIWTFFSVNLADTAIQTASEDIEVTGQNVANASTPGYTEEVAQNTATPPYTVPMLQNPDPGQIGTGVEVSRITRQTNPWVNQQVNDADSTLSYWENLNNQLQVAQSAFQEPTSIGLQSAMDTFFNEWQTLSEDPTNMGSRASVVSDATQLIDDFHTSAGLLSQTAADIQNQMTGDVGTINQLARQIVNLNQQIAAVSAQGEQPNDLEDSRDLLINQLAQLAPVSVTPDGSNNGTVSVNIYGEQLLSSTAGAANTVSINSVPDPASPAGDDTVLNIAGNPTTIYLFGTSLSAAYASSGGLTGLEAARQKTDGYLNQLDTLAYNLVQQVNMQHQQGANGQSLIASASIAFAAGSFTISVNNGSPVTLNFSNTLGTNEGLLQGLASAINSSTLSTEVKATVVNNPQNGTAYLNVVSSTSVPVPVSLGDVAGGGVIAYTGGSAGYTGTYDYNGHPGGLFFNYLDSAGGAAANIALSPNISPNADGSNPNLDAIAAASTTLDQRDGNNALAVFNLQNATWGSLNNGSFDSYYETTTEAVGADVQSATQMQNTAQAAATQLVNMQQSVSGVSTDGEMTRLIQYQYAYQAAAEFLAVQNNLLNTLINNTLNAG